MDFPNSNKARKVFLVLMVGSGGQVPQGLQGDAEGVENEDQVKFERRRERAKARSSMKKKNIKDRDWILKKKEVCDSPLLPLAQVDTQPHPVVSTTRERGRPSGLKIHCPEAKDSFLTSLDIDPYLHIH